MNAWTTPICRLAAADRPLFSSICAVLAVLLLVIIVLGFGPLRTWLGMDMKRGRLAHHSIHEAGNLRVTWRLYRHLGHNDHFSMTDIPSVIVPNAMADKEEASAAVPSSALIGWSIAHQASLVHSEN